MTVAEGARMLFVRASRAVAAVSAFAVTFFENFAAQTKREESLSLDALADRARRTTAATKEALPWLKLARFGVIPNPRTSSGSLRWNGNVLRISGAIGDYDAGEISSSPVLLDETKAARILGLSVKTLRRWRRAGKGPAFRKLGRAVRYASNDLEAFIASALRTSTSDTGGGLCAWESVVASPKAG